MPIVEQDAVGLYVGAHHVLHDLSQSLGLSEVLAPVLEALDKQEPETHVPPKANTAFQSLSS